MYIHNVKSDADSVCVCVCVRERERVFIKDHLLKIVLQLSIILSLYVCMFAIVRRLPERGRSKKILTVVKMSPYKCNCVCEREREREREREGGGERNREK